MFVAGFNLISRVAIICTCKIIWNTKNATTVVVPSNKTKDKLNSLYTNKLSTSRSPIGLYKIIQKFLKCTKNSNSTYTLCTLLLLLLLVYKYLIFFNNNQIGPVPSSLITTTTTTTTSDKGVESCCFINTMKSLNTISRQRIFFSTIVSTTSRRYSNKQGLRVGSWYRAGERAQSTSSAGNPNFAGQSSGGFSGGNERNTTNGSRFQTIPFYSYFRSLKWAPIPLSLGFALLAYQHYRRVLRRGTQSGAHTTDEERLQNDWEIKCYRAMPWKSVSKVWGWVNSIDLPPWAREPVLKWYVNAFNCDLSEAEVDDLTAYRNLGEFFRRDLKNGVRPIDPTSPVVSPADGRILHFGKVDCGVIEQVKGVSYSLPAFLGPPTWKAEAQNSLVQTSSTNYSARKINSENYCSSILKHNVGTSLYYFVVYLAPGDYHKFHSPAEWQVEFRRHFAGELLSVSPSVAGWIGGLFSLNERAVYVGNWKHGFFSMTAVGATNVGSIRVYGDSDLETNSRRIRKNTHEDKRFSTPIKISKGEPFGEFNLGSTIVIIFEAPDDFKFGLINGEKVKVGEGVSPTTTGK